MGHLAPDFKTIADLRRNNGLGMRLAPLTHASCHSLKP